MEQPPEPFILDRNIVLLWFGQVISALGDWCLWIAIPVAVYNRTNSRIDLAFTLLTETLPLLIFSPIAGIVVDRTDRRKTMITADIVRAALVALLAIPFFHVTPLWEYYAVLFCAMAGSAFFMPARIVILTTIVPSRQYMRVNSLLATSLKVSDLAGPALGGVILATMGQRGAFAADSISFLVSAACIAALSVSAIPAARKAVLTFATALEDLRSGIDVIRQSRLLRGLLVCYCTGFFATSVFTALLYAVARDVLHVNKQLYGAMMSFTGIGLLTAGVLVGALFHKRNPVHLILVGLALSAVGSTMLSVTHTYILACSALFVGGMGALFVTVPSNTMVQTHVKREMLGRFSSAFTLTAYTAQLFGAACAGFAATLISLPHIYAAVTFVYLLSAVLAIYLMLDRSNDSNGESVVERKTARSQPSQ